LAQLLDKVNQPRNRNVFNAFTRWMACLAGYEQLTWLRAEFFFTLLGQAGVGA
jgi:hypothetical protein